MSDELEVLLYGHPSLRRTCTAVEVFDDGLRELVAQMERTMVAQRGIGLAAPQVGRDLRLLLAEHEGGKRPQILALANPEIVWTSSERDKFSEGCLSLPEIFEDVVRPVAIRVRYQDVAGNEQELEDDGMLARIVQHEVDHLDGVLFVDHLSLLRRKLIAKKLKALTRRAREQQTAQG